MTRSSELPTGVVTFLFTDIEGSTRLLQKLGGDYPAVLEEHANRLRAALAAHHGVEVSTEGDAFFAVFGTPSDAVAAAADAQRAFATQELPGDETIKVRMGLHTGIGRLGGDNYAGLDVHRAARIAGAANGGQVLLSEATQLLASSELPVGVSLRDLGTLRLKDLDKAEHLLQLVIDGLESDFAPPRAARPGNIAASATIFVGRAKELDQLEGLITGTRIITLTGPGGAGKTRLAIESGRRMSEHFPDGAFFVQLESIREPQLVPSAISRVLDLAQKDEDTLDLVTAYLRDRRILLILDNFEQVLRAGPMIAQVAAAGEGSRILITSRAALRLYGEQEFPVPPLSLPDPAHLPPLARVSEFESVQLFIARARSVRPDFAVTNENAAAIAQLCARLDGLPLAIELAAARIKILAPQAILSRLDSHLDVLSAGATNLPERQRTLRAAIAWSYDLLDRPVQQLLQRLSVFSGGATLDAIERVCNRDRELGIDPFDGLETLVGYNLVRQQEMAAEPRFTLLETIREFGLAQLEAAGERGEIAARHASWVEALVDSSEELLRSGRDAAYERIETEYANIQAALRWAIDTGNAPPAQRICASVWRFWQRKGLIVEGRWWVGQVLGLAAAGERTSARAGALAALGSLAYWAGDIENTRKAYEESLEIYQEVGDELGIAIGTYNLAFPQLLAERTDVARELITDSKRRFEELNNAFWTVETSVTLGYIEILAGNLETGEGLIRSALPLIPEDTVRQADLWLILAQVEWKRGNMDGARSAIRKALALLERGWDATLAVGLYELRGIVEITAGNLAWGLRLYAGASGMRERIGGGPPFMIVMHGGDVEEARVKLGEAEADRIVAEGRTLTDDELLALAASDAPAAPA
jgi:predicted ATPase/class 3 adenylate cyclase